jgi:transposase
VPSHGNPIEEAFSKVKHLLRKIAPRTKEVLVEALGLALGAVSAQVTGGYFAHCRYCAPAQ